MIAAVRLRPYTLPLRRPWVAASATITVRRGMLVRLEAIDGTVGWGDCAPLPSSGDTGHRRVFEALSTVAGRLPGQPVDEIPAGLAPPEVGWAVETAIMDLRARRRGVGLARLLAEAAVPAVAVNAALGPLDAGCVGRATAALARGFDLGKIKVGLAPVAEELQALRRLNRHLGGRMRLRLDANRAWENDDARSFLAGLAGLPVDGIEEPLADPTLDSLARLQDTVAFAVAIDESLARLGLDAVIDAGAVRRLVVKPARLGGLGRTLDLAARARDAGLELVLTSVVDSAIGLTAAAQLAAALPLPAAHGLATSDWLAEDVCLPPVVASGWLRLPDGPGLGRSPLDQPA
ncbi:MAG: o-succinylbenzoate synthase [Magnetospirillum sp.]|nr:MAG: o-succinylbenzoate synthase [Magnetospirillum sp.]